MGILLIVFAVFAISCTYFKPSFYWDSRKAARLRNLLGDLGTSIFYYAIGVMLLVFGILDVTNISPLK